METTPQERLQRQLEGHPFCSGLEPTDIGALAERASLVEFAAREVLFQAGGDAETFYLIRSGMVSLNVDTGGPYPTVVQHISEGAVLGWSWLFEPYKWQFDAVAVSPVRGVAIDAIALREHFDRDQPCGYRVMARVAVDMADRLSAARLKLLHR